MPEEIAEKIMLKVGDLVTMLNVSESHVYDMEADGRMPRRIKLGSRMMRWNKKEIDAWIASGCPRVRTPLEQVKKSGKTPELKLTQPQETPDAE